MGRHNSNPEFRFNHLILETSIKDPLLNVVGTRCYLYTYLWTTKRSKETTNRNLSGSLNEFGRYIGSSLFYPSYTGRTDLSKFKVLFHYYYEIEFILRLHNMCLNVDIMVGSFVILYSITNFLLIDVPP